MSLIPGVFGQRSFTADPFSLDLWDPFADWPITSRSATNERSQLAATPVDWRETAEAHVFKADVPGLKKEEVKVDVEEGNILQISGERCREKEDKNETWHRMERTYGRFRRRFRLPDNAKLDQIKASLENGVLTVIVPKGDVKKPEVKAIEISG